MMNLDLRGKSALVTAATSGIGLATAQLLAEMGAKVWLNGRSPDRLQAAADSIRSAVPDADLGLVAGDVATIAGAAQVTNAVDDIDILVNMAGGTDHHKPFPELTDDDWQAQWDFNVMSAVRLTRHYMPSLLAKSFGRIVFVSSAAGLVTDPDTADYGVVKAAVIRLSRAVAEAFIGADTTVNCVVPGSTMSDWVYKAADGVPIQDFSKTMFPGDTTTSLLRRFAEATEVANLIGYLCSPASTATRGAVLRVDGGRIRTD